MILTCPNCSTRYLLNSSMLGAEGRKVRCANCAHVWFQEPDDFIPDEDIPDVTRPPEVDDDEPIPRATNLPARGDEDIEEIEDSRRYAMMVFAALFIAGLVGLFAGREALVKAFPESNRLFAMLSMQPPAPGEGLAFENIKAIERTAIDGRKMIRISGEIANLTGDTITLPPIEARLKGALSVIRTWPVESPVTELEGGSRVKFNTRLDDPGSEGITVIVTFAEEG